MGHTVPEQANDVLNDGWQTKGTVRVSSATSQPTGTTRAEFAESARNLRALVERAANIVYNPHSYHPVRTSDLRVLLLVTDTDT